MQVFLVFNSTALKKKSEILAFAIKNSVMFPATDQTPCHFVVFICPAFEICFLPKKVGKHSSFQKLCKHPLDFTDA